MHNPYNLVTRTEATDPSVQAKTITYTYTEDNNAVPPVKVVREHGTKGRPRVLIMVDHYMLFLTNIHTVFPGPAATGKITPVKEKPLLKETTVEVFNKEEVRTDLVYMDSEGHTEVVLAKRGIPAPKHNSKILFERVKYVFKGKASSSRTSPGKIPTVESFRNVNKAYSVYVYSNGTEVESKGKGAPKRMLPTGETLVHIIKVKPLKKPRNSKKKATFVHGNAPIKEDTGNRTVLKDLKEGDRFYRVDTITGEVMKSQGVMILTATGDVCKFDLSIPMKIGSDILTTNTVRGSALSQSVYKLN